MTHYSLRREWRDPEKPRQPASVSKSPPVVNRAFEVYATDRSVMPSIRHTMLMPVPVGSSVRIALEL